MTSAIQVNRTVPYVRAQPSDASMSPASFSGFSLGA